MSALTPVSGWGIWYACVPSGASFPPPTLTSGWNVFSAPGGGLWAISVLNAWLEYGVTLICPFAPGPPATVVPEDHAPDPAPPGALPAFPGLPAEAGPAAPAPPPVTAVPPALVGAPVVAG